MVNSKMELVPVIPHEKYKTQHVKHTANETQLLPNDLKPGYWLKKCRSLQTPFAKLECFAGYIAKPAPRRKYSNFLDFDHFKVLTHISIEPKATKHQEMENRKKTRFEKRKERLLEIDAANGTNYYEKYLRRRCINRAKRQAMGDRIHHKTCCVIL